MMEWHRLFGLALTDYFTDSAYHVELEKDLSLKQQFLDVAIIEQETGQPLPEPPDGLENLARHNLLTYKSPRQPLDGWAFDELLGHYVNYRKQISPSWEKLLPVEDFRLYAVSTRAPEKLATEVSLMPLKAGVYETPWGTQKIRIIVLSQVPKIERNAIWQLFSGIAEKVQYGVLNYRWHRSDHSKITNDLYQFYQVEGITMPYTWEDYEKDYFERHKDRILKYLPTEELLKELPPEERLKGLPVEERLKGLPVEERLKGLPVEAFLKHMPAAAIEAYVKKLRQKKRKSSKKN
jgi:hypothetical protein